MANTNKFGDDWDFSLASTDICGDSVNINMTRGVTNVRTNCGNDVVAGANEYTWDISGPLGFGSGSTESVAFTSIAAASAEAWEWDPDGSGSASATNPILSGNSLTDSYSISASVGGPITYSLSGQGTDSTGLPTRTTS